MDFAEEVARRKAELAGQQQQADDDFKSRAEELIAILNELAPDVVAGCKALALKPDVVQLPGSSGFEGPAWVVAVNRSNPPLAVAFREDNTWEFIKPSNTAGLHGEMRWPALKGFARVLIGAPKADIEEAIADDLATR